MLAPIEIKKESFFFLNHIFLTICLGYRDVRRTQIQTNNLMNYELSLQPEDCIIRKFNQFTDAMIIQSVGVVLNISLVQSVL